MFCKTCGKEINDNAVICPSCGCAVQPVEQKVEQNKKPNILCIVGFVLSIVSVFLALYGTVAIVGLILSIVGIVQAKKNEQSMKGLGIAGIIVSVASLFYTFYVIFLGIAFLSVL